MLDMLRYRYYQSGEGAKSPPPSLTTGVYWADGDVSLAPLAGNYTLTTTQNDGSAGDTTTRVTGTGDKLTIVHVLASPLAIAAWEQTCKFLGSLTSTFTKWTGSSWAAMADTNGLGWTVHVSYDNQSRTATFADEGDVTIIRVVIDSSDTTGDAFASSSDSRPA